MKTVLKIILLFFVAAAIKMVVSGLFQSGKYGILLGSCVVFWIFLLVLSMRNDNKEKNP